MRGATVAITPMVPFVLLPSKFANDLIIRLSPKAAFFVLLQGIKLLFLVAILKPGLCDRIHYESLKRIISGTES